MLFSQVQLDPSQLPEPPLPGKDDVPVSQPSGNATTSMHALILVRPYIIASAIILLASMVFGFMRPEVFSGLMEELEGLVTEIRGRGFFSTVIFIFFNNLKAALAAMIMGPLLGIVPVLQASLNGAIIGVVIREATAHAGLLAIILGLLPHGLFEIPAMLISWGTGIWLGLWPFKKDTLRFRQRMRLAAGILLRIVLPLLAIAALIEGALISALKGG